MKRRDIQQIIVFTALATAGVTVRLAMEHVPNFAPVAALALFAGYYFRHVALAIALPLCVMMISDWKIGGYQPLLMITVYAALTVPVLLRGRIRRMLPIHGASWRQSALSSVGLIGCSFASSLFFFVVTNFMVWFATSHYESTAAGLVTCMVRALPFFRYTLLGDMIFATVLFGSYAWLIQFAAVRQRNRTRDVATTTVG